MATVEEEQTVFQIELRKLRPRKYLKKKKLLFLENSGFFLLSEFDAAKLPEK
jgi:hypothetical protein